MIKRMVTSAVFAGLAAGLLAALLHFAFVQKLILLGEQYEFGDLVHFPGGDAATAGHDHGTAAAEATGESDGQGDGESDGHEHAPADPEDGGLRDVLTVLFYTVVYVSYGLMLAAGFAVAETFGKAITPVAGLLWGLAGFAAFQLTPALGLAPELPGAVAADLTQRQLWWLATALCTAGGLALLGYGRGIAAWGAAVLLLALPHVIGAPMLEGYAGMAPPELASAYAARSLAVGLSAWALLGVLTGKLWSRGGAH